VRRPKHRKLWSVAGPSNGENTYKRLHYLYRLADDKYNSGLFHFEEEKGRSEAPDKLTLNLKIDDKVLKDIIRRLYYPESPYEFSVLGADILGNVYEQFLGKVIRLSAGHRAIVEEKPEVKKAGGVYYTPEYVVEYIVKNTVGKLCEGRSPRQIDKLRILDPACGSGSFLIGAYKYLLDYHRDWYFHNGPPKHTKEIYQGAGGHWYLTTQEKKRILLNNIYGVDIDNQAVEVTKLSLLLKVLEGENQDSLTRQLKMWRERALPDLGNNIKSGNSLIGPDFYQNQQMSLLDEEDRYRINVFDWNSEFSSIMESRRFDAVIGNPPWGADFTGPELAYLREKYRGVIARMIDSYIYFTDRAIRLANVDGFVGFIVPSTLLNQVDAKPIRALLLSRSLSALISLGQGIFGAKVLNTSTIFVTATSATRNDFILKDLSAFPLNERKNALGTTVVSNWKQWKSLVERDPHLTFFVGALGSTELLDRLRRNYPSLEKAVQNRIERGVSPDIVAAHVVSACEVKAKRLEGDLLRPSISGAQIRRYIGWTSDQFIIYTSRETQIGKHPNTEKHLKSFKPLNHLQGSRAEKASLVVLASTS
jgi:type I restriction-modification system DNA methylase subunit